MSKTNKSEVTLLSHSETTEQYGKKDKISSYWRENIDYLQKDYTYSAKKQQQKRQLSILEILNGTLSTKNSISR